MSPSSQASLHSLPELPDLPRQHRREANVSDYLRKFRGPVAAVLIGATTLPALTGCATTALAEPASPTEIHEHSSIEAEAVAHEVLSFAPTEKLQAVDIALKAELTALPELEAVAGFIEKVPIRFDLPGGNFEPQQFAKYEQDGIFLNRGKIDGMLYTLTAKGASAEEAARVVAIKMLPIVAHEISHGITNDALDARGVSFPVALIEDEVLGHVEQARILVALMDKHPDVFGNQAFKLDAVDRYGEGLLNVLERGLDGLTYYVKAQYSNVPDLDTIDREAMAALHTENAKRANDILERYESLEHKAEHGWTSWGRQRAKDELRELPPKRQMQDIAYKAPLAAKTLRDDAAFEKMRAYYGDRLDAVEAELATPKWASWRHARGVARDAKIATRLDEMQSVIEDAMASGQKWKAKSEMYDYARRFQDLTPAGQLEHSATLAALGTPLIGDFVERLNVAKPFVLELEVLDLILAHSDVEPPAEMATIYENAAKERLGRARLDAHRGRTEAMEEMLAEALAYASKAGVSIAGDVAEVRGLGS